MLAETALILPEEMRAQMVAGAFAQGVPELREAGLGWLLDDAAPVRRMLMQALGGALGEGGVSGVMLRRMIAVRNWLPEEDRPHLDRVIKTARQKKVACESWPKAKVLETYVSGFDGAGAQSVILVTSEGRKRCFAGLRIQARHRHPRRRGSAPAHADGSQHDAEPTLASQMHLTPAGLDYVAAATRHFLGVNAQSGITPRVQPARLRRNRRAVRTQSRASDGGRTRVASLRARHRAGAGGAGAVAAALADSAAWSVQQPIADSWFEDGDEIAALLAPRMSKAKRKAALLAMPLQKRRRWWAELIAWTAYSIKCDPSGSGWEEFALVARELLGGARLERVRRHERDCRHYAGRAFGALSRRRQSRLMTPVATADRLKLHTQAKIVSNQTRRRNTGSSTSQPKAEYRNGRSSGCQSSSCRRLTMGRITSSE